MTDEQAPNTKHPQWIDLLPQLQMEKALLRPGANCSPFRSRRHALYLLLLYLVVLVVAAVGTLSEALPDPACLPPRVLRRSAHALSLGMGYGSRGRASSQRLQLLALRTFHLAPSIIQGLLNLVFFSFISLATNPEKLR